MKLLCAQRGACIGLCCSQLNHLLMISECSFDWQAQGNWASPLYASQLSWLEETVYGWAQATVWSSQSRWLRVSALLFPQTDLSYTPSHSSQRRSAHSPTHSNQRPTSLTFLASLSSRISYLSLTLLSPSLYLSPSVSRSLFHCHLPVCVVWLWLLSTFPLIPTPLPPPPSCL